MARACAIIVRAKAEADIADAIEWYEGQRAGLGEEFLAEVKRAIAVAAASPFLHARLRRKPDVRRVLTKRFPYRVFFVRRQRTIVVFRVLHASRHEREWQSQVPAE